MLSSLFFWFLNWILLSFSVKKSLFSSFRVRKSSVQEKKKKNWEISTHPHPIVVVRVKFSVDLLLAVFFRCFRCEIAVKARATGVKGLFLAWNQPKQFQPFLTFASPFWFFVVFSQRGWRASTDVKSQPWYEKEPIQPAALNQMNEPLLSKSTPQPRTSPLSIFHSTSTPSNSKKTTPKTKAYNLPQITQVRTVLVNRTYPS